MSIVLFFEQRLSLLGRMRTMCTDKEFVEKKGKEIVAACLDKLVMMKPPSVPDATSLSELFEKAPVSAADKSKLIASLMALTTDESIRKENEAQPYAHKYKGPQAQNDTGAFSRMTQGSAYPKWQTHKHIHQYMTKDEWLEAADKARPLACRVLPLVKAMHRCGWVRYSEPQLAEVVGTLGPLGVDTAGESGLAVLSYLKDALGLLSRKTVRPDDSILVWDFPSNPNDLPEPWRTTSQDDGELVPSPIAFKDLEWHRHRTPCRRSHKDVQRQQHGNGNMLSLEDLPNHGAQPVQGLQHGFPAAMWHQMHAYQMANAWPQLPYGAQHQPGQRVEPKAPGDIPLTLFPPGERRSTFPGTEGSVPGREGSVPGTEGSAQPAPAEQPQSQPPLLSWGSAVSSVPPIEDRNSESPAEGSAKLPLSLSSTIGQTRSLLQEASQARKMEPKDKDVRKNVHTGGAKPKASAKRKPKAAAKGKPKAVAKIWGDKLLLGCAKCRANTHIGCAQCQDPGFGGKRGPTSWYPAGKKRR